MTVGTLKTINGRPALRVERTLAHSVERVWRAISEPAEPERWFPAAANWTPATGETFEACGATGACHKPIRWRRRSRADTSDHMAPVPGRKLLLRRWADYLGARRRTVRSCPRLSSPLGTHPR
jgi:hypothetical protein